MTQSMTRLSTTVVLVAMAAVTAHVQARLPRPPGAHVVTMVPAPNFHRAVLRNHQRIYVDAGRPNFFTLSWLGGDVPVLK